MPLSMLINVLKSLQAPNKIAKAKWCWSHMTRCYRLTQTFCVGNKREEEEDNEEKKNDISYFIISIDSLRPRFG